MHVRVDLKPLPRVKCRLQRLSAVFSNLLRHAAAAVDEQGRIEIRGHRRNRKVVFRVADNGLGIPARRLSRLFEPALEVKGEGTTATVSLPLTGRRKRGSREPQAPPEAALLLS